MNIVDDIERISILMYRETDVKKRDAMMDELRKLEIRLNQMAIWGDDGE